MMAWLIACIRRMRECVSERLRLRLKTLGLFVKWAGLWSGACGLAIDGGSTEVMGLEARGIEGIDASSCRVLKRDYIR